MKKLAGWFVVMALVCGAANGWAQDAQRKAVAEELLTVMKMQRVIEDSFAAMKRMLPSQIKRMTTAANAGDAEAATRDAEKVMDMVSEELAWNKMKDDYVALYADVFTEEELKGLIAFYKSPIGQAFIGKQPVLTSRSMEISQKLMQNLMPKIKAMTEASKAAKPAPGGQP